MGEFNVSGSPKPGVKMADFEAAILAELARVQKDGVTEDELKLARNSLLSSAIYARDSLRTGPNVIGRALTTGHTLDDVEQWPDRIAAVTRDDVNRVAREALRDQASVTATLFPGPKK